MTQRTKNILLVGTFCLGLFLTFKLGISKTTSLMKEVNSMEFQSQNLIKIKNGLLNLKARENYADSLLQKNNIKNTSLQNNLLSVLTSTSETADLKVSNFNEPHIFIDKNVQRTSYQFSLVGDFNDILSLIYSLEQKYSFGNVSYLNFEKKKDYRKRKDYLSVDVILENFISE